MIRVLLAEDNPMNRELIREVLEASGYMVTEAADGSCVLEQLEQSVPDVVLLDIQMPKLDGYAVVQRLRQDPRFRSLPVIALTAYAMSGDREKALAAGFDAHLSKPLDFVALRSTIKRLVRSNLAQGEE